MSKLIKKITPKTVLGKIKSIAHDLTETTPVMRVVGIARGLSTGEGDYGSWVKFKGDFSATNLLTGDVFRSPACILPGIAGDLIESAVMDSENNGVEFGFDITLEPSDSPVGYEFSAIPLLETKEETPLDSLMALVNDAHALPLIGEDEAEAEVEAEKAKPAAKKKAAS